MGHIPEIRKMHKIGVYTHNLFLKWAEEYGPLYKVFLFHKCMLIPTSRTILEEILTKKQYSKAHVVYKRLYHTCGQRFLGNGLVTNTDHSSWMKRRAAIDPAFHRKYLMSLMNQFNTIADTWIKQLEIIAESKSMFSMADVLYRVTLDVIGKVAFNMDIEAILDQNSPVPSSLDKILQGFSAQLRDPLLLLKPNRRTFVKDVQQAAKYLRNEAKKTIENRIEAIKREHKTPDDILSFMIKSAAVNDEVEMEDLVDDFMTLFIAGQETTSNTLSFLLNEVGQRPDIYARLQSEVDQVVSDSCHVSYEQTTRLNYMSQVWRETLRLYPPAPGTARENTSECELDGWKIPKKTFLTVSFFVNHRLSHNFKDPLSFNPERFSPGHARLDYSYMPFSLGPRSCAGQHFAQIESKVLLSKFLQKFNFELDTEQSFEVLETTTLRPKGGTMLKLTLR